MLAFGLGHSDNKCRFFQKIYTKTRFLYHVHDICIHQQAASINELTKSLPSNHHNAFLPISHTRPTLMTLLEYSSPRLLIYSSFPLKMNHRLYC